MPVKSNLSVVPVSCGAVLRCRPVPPFATAAVRSKLPDPPFPKVTVESAAGGPEKHPALPGTPEYDAWAEAQRVHKRMLGLALERFTFNYGTVDWCWPEDLDNFDPEDPNIEWIEQPPKEWVLPPIMKEYGVSALEGPDRRAQYILYELVLTDSDTSAVEQIVLQPPPLGKEEILAALGPFVSREMEGHLNTQKPPPED